jgi:hypothetical protein
MHARVCTHVYALLRMHVSSKYKAGHAIGREGSWKHHFALKQVWQDNHVCHGISVAAGKVVAQGSARARTVPGHPLHFMRSEMNACVKRMHSCFDGEFSSHETQYFKKNVDILFRANKAAPVSNTWQGNSGWQ